MAQAPAQVSYQSTYYDDHYEEQAASIREQRVQPLLCAFYDSFAERVFELTGASALGRPVRVFEAGCGEGLVAAALRRVADRRGIALEYTGCDLSAVGLELLAETVPGTFLPGDAVQVAASLPAGSADVVVAKNLLHHIDDPDAFLAQAGRVAGPDGHVLVLEARLAQPLNFLASLPFYEREKLFFRGAGRNRRAALDAGLEIAHAEPFNWFPFELACATRLRAPRRALARVRGRRTLDRVVRLDERLTRLMPWFAQYTLWKLSGSGRDPADELDASTQREWQREHYDMHYPRHAPHVREQRVHPLFRSFNDRLAGLVLGLGADGGEDDRGLDVFEAGCGEGLLATSLQGVAAQQGREVRYTGSDLSPAGIELAAEAVTGTFVAGDATEVAATLPDAGFDVVIAKNLLHHIDDPVAFLCEARRLVRPSGRIVVVEARLGYAPTFLACLLIPHQERYFFLGRRRNVRAADAAGLDLVASRRFGWFPYELAFSTRFRTVRRLFRLRRAATIERFWTADERLASAMPWFTAYELWALEPAAEAAAGAGGVSNV